MIGFLIPPSHRDRLPENEIDPAYKRLRLQVFLGIFVGYAGYYLVRKNFTLAMPFLVEEGYSKTELGFALSGVAIAYGLSKFLMGSVSDRSNARNFMASGLLASALIMIVMGTVPFATSSVSIAGHTDTSGASAYNQRLSQRRADIVGEALVARGIDASLISEEAKGETDLAKATRDGVREPLNRRSEVVITVQ